MGCGHLEISGFLSLAVAKAAVNIFKLIGPPITK
jgi:hypothetical protein